jgi:hypothetical protein
MSLSGAWSGVYHYPHGFGIGSTPFLLTMEENAGQLSGMIEEPDLYGVFGSPVMYASFNGQRTANTVSFEKVYEDAPLGHPAITYVGEVNADETRIEGQWVIHGEATAAFELERRADPVAQSATRKAKVKT